MSYVAFSLDHHIARRSVSPSLKLLDQLGLIEIEPGVRLVNHFRFSNRWRISLDLKEVVTEGNNSKPAKTASNPKSPKPMTIARPRTIQRRVPSLPTMPWQDDGR